MDSAVGTVSSATTGQFTLSKNIGESNARKATATSLGFFDPVLSRNCMTRRFCTSS